MPLNQSESIKRFSLLSINPHVLDQIIDSRFLTLMEFFALKEVLGAIINITLQIVHEYFILMV